MSTSYNYNEKLRKQLLKELEEGSDIEDLSKKYHVHVSVIENWKKQEESNKMISSAFNKPTDTVKKSWYRKIILFFSTINSKLLKGKLLAGIFGIGLIAAIVIANFFFGKAEFKIRPKVEFAEKIESLVLISSKIEKKLDEQIKINKSIKKTISINSPINNTKFNINHLNSQKKRNIKRYFFAHRTTYCCQHCNCHKDSIK